ncbi:MAG: hypothetical protein V4850_29475 [Myxococcota bacterium]
MSTSSGTSSTRSTQVVSRPVHAMNWSSPSWNWANAGSGSESWDASTTMVSHGWHSPQPDSHDAATARSRELG